MIRNAREKRWERRRTLGPGAALALAACLALPAAGTAGGDGLSEVASAAVRLRMALAARDAGALDDADALFVRAAELHPLVGDHAQSLRAALLLDAGRFEAAVGAAQRGLADHPDTPLRARLQRIAAQAWLGAGDEPAARAALEQALAAQPGAELRAEIELELAGSLERAGQGAAAAARYRDVWIALASPESAAAAGARLDALEAQLGRPLREAGDWLARADALMGAQRSEEALGAYETALGRGLAAGRRGHAQAQRAQCLFLLRRYAEAASAFAALASRDPGARIQEARAVARGGDLERAVAMLEEQAQRGPRRLRPRARYLAGLLVEDDDPARARGHFEALVREHRDPGFVRAARWSLGWDDYRAQRYDAAQAQLARLAAEEPDPIEGLRARYWEARALEPADPEAAGRALAQLAAEYPLTYYGWRARARLPLAPALPARGAALAPAGLALRPARLARVRVLLATGLPEEARAELDALAPLARGGGDALELATLYSEAGDPAAAQRLILARYEADLARGPAPGHEEAWWLAWPRAWEDDVQRWSAASRGGVEPALVYAVMREESGYRPQVVSTAGALGLLQIMPETGARLARDAGLGGFAAADLLRPEVNIRLGTLYLDELGRHFGGRASASVGSYNAGAEAVGRWLAERPGLPDDEWVESMPYEQTRKYVKRVLRSLHAYQVLY